MLEILLVLSLIALASVLVVPNVGSLEARNYSMQLRQVNALLHYARRNAVITGLPVSARLYGPLSAPMILTLHRLTNLPVGKNAVRGRAQSCCRRPRPTGKVTALP